ncbi:MAG: sugar kinase [Gammaproteobacteria bacterium]|nr:sugar kinase [Gammaproteobacteria bacterium]
MRTGTSGARYENVVIVTRPTELDELIARFNTEAQAKFYLTQAGQSFDRIRRAHESHYRTLTEVRKAIPPSTKHQVVSRELLPMFTFGDDDLVVTVGQDGLVSNTAKYLGSQPILAVNPDPALFDGVLLPFTAQSVGDYLNRALKGEHVIKAVTMALARLADGQALLAFNDFFIGANSHVSARYEIEVAGQRENQSSSGIIVSTGAGSTGWLRSVYAGAAGVVEALGGTVRHPQGLSLPWDTDRLVYSVREPFPSQVTQCSLVHGAFDDANPLKITSRMARNGLIFSDGVEADYLEFNSGAELTITTAPRQAHLIARPSERGIARAAR